MLGINSRRELVKPAFAKIMQESLKRVLTGEFTPEEKSQILRDRKYAKQFDIVWR